MRILEADIRRFSGQPTGVTSFPDQIQALAFQPSHLIDPSVSDLRLGGFRDQIKRHRKAAEREGFRYETVAVYYAHRGEGIQDPDVYYYPSSARDGSIKIKFKVQRQTQGENARRTAVIMQSYLTDSLPMPPNLKHVLLADHEKAASAAFILTPNNMFAVFRGPGTPQFGNESSACAVIEQLDLDLKRLVEEGGHPRGLALASLSREYYQALDLQLFHAKANGKVLVRSTPERHSFVKRSLLTG